MWNNKHENFFPPSFSNFPTHFFEFWLSPKSMWNRIDSLFFVFPIHLSTIHSLSLDFSSLSRFQISLRTLSSRAFFFLPNSDTQNSDSSIRREHSDEGFEGWHRHAWLRGGCRVWDSDQMPLWGENHQRGVTGSEGSNRFWHFTREKILHVQKFRGKFWILSGFMYRFWYFQVLCVEWWLPFPTTMGLRCPGRGSNVKETCGCDGWRDCWTQV